MLGVLIDCLAPCKVLGGSRSIVMSSDLGSAEASEGRKKCNKLKMVARCHAIVKSPALRARDHPYSTLALQCLEASAEQAQKQEQINATHPLQTGLAKATHLSIEVRMLSRNGPGLQVHIRPSGRCIASVILCLLHFFLPSLAAVSPILRQSDEWPHVWTNLRMEY